jgi:hypothetical protein
MLSCIIIRVIGALLLLGGAAIVLFDTNTIAIGEPNATVLAMLLAFGQMQGYALWYATLMWMMPMVVGSCMLFIPLGSPQRRRLRRTPGT